MKTQLSQLITSIGLLFLSLITGISGFILLEKFSFIDAIYMTVITISTVGFAEVHKLSEAGKLFTTLFILMNLGIFTYFVSVLTSYLLEGKLRQVFKKYLVDRKINKLKDHVIVCGFGRNGLEACKELRQSGFEFVVIESNASTVESMSEEFDCHVVFGDATQELTLIKANIKLAKQIIITTHSDADNVFISLSSRKLNPGLKIISRATFRESESKLYTAGADHVILPSTIGGMFMAQIITKPVVIEFLDLLTGRSKTKLKYRLESISYDQLKSIYKDQPLKNLHVNTQTGCTVIGVKDDIKGMIPNPGPETFISKNDCLIILGSEKSLNLALSIYTHG